MFLGYKAENMVFMAAKKEGPEQHEHDIKKSVAVFFMSSIFNIKILYQRTDRPIFAGLKQQVVCFCFSIEHMGEKLGKGIVFCGQVKKVDWKVEARSSD